MTITDRLRRFFYGRGFVMLTACLIFASHSTLRIGDDLVFGGYQEFLFGGILIALVALGCLVCNDLRFLLMPAMAGAFLVPTYHGLSYPYVSRFYFEHLPIALEYVLGLLLIGGLICFVARNRPNKVAFHKPIFLGLAIFCATMMFNGIGSRFHCLSDVIYPLTLVVSLVGFYLLFAAYVRFDRSVFDHFMFCVLMLGIMIFAQLMFTYLDKGPDGMKFTAAGGVDKSSLHFGWGNSNAIGGMLAFLMPSGFYFAHSHRRGWIYYFLSCLMYVGVILSQSRGALVAATCTLGISVLILLCSGKNRIVNRVLTSSILLVGVAVCALYFDQLLRLVKTMTDLGSDDNGRYEIWTTAFSYFKEAPIFGAGFYTEFEYGWAQKMAYPYLYHNTPIQVLCSGGVVAFAAYSWHRLTTLRLLFRRSDPYKTYMWLCIMGLLIFCLFETIFFATYPTIIYAIMLLFMEQKDRFSPQSTEKIAHEA